VAALLSSPLTSPPAGPARSAVTRALWQTCAFYCGGMWAAGSALDICYGRRRSASSLLGAEGGRISSYRSVINNLVSNGGRSRRRPVWASPTASTRLQAIFHGRRRRRRRRQGRPFNHHREWIVVRAGNIPSCIIRRGFKSDRRCFSTTLARPPGFALMGFAAGGEVSERASEDDCAALPGPP